MSVQDDTKARRILAFWRGASEAHIRSDLQRASNEAGEPKDKRISVILNAHWNKHLSADNPFLNHHLISFNLACYCCHLEQFDDALRWINRTVDLLAIAET